MSNMKTFDKPLKYEIQMNNCRPENLSTERANKNNFLIPGISPTTWKILQWEAINNSLCENRILEKSHLWSIPAKNMP